MGPSFNEIRIILIEDDAELCRGWVELFEMLGHPVVGYQRALDALNDKEVIRTSNLLITDYYLPDLNGVDLIRRMLQENPALRSILLTGSKEPSVVEAARVIPKCSILHKPLNIEDLERRIHDIFEPAA